MTAKSSSGNFRRILIIVLLLAAGVGGWVGWNMFFRGNVQTKDHSPEFLYIRTGSTMEDLLKLLEAKELIKDKASFEWMAKLKKFETVKPGRYRIRDGMSNRELINILNNGLQEKVEFTFNEVYTKEQMAGRVGAKLEADSTEILELLNDNDFLNKYGLSSENVMTLFMPDKYSFNWNTSAEEFFQSMAKVYKDFWTDERKQLAKSIGLSQTEAITLASIVEAEQRRYAEERPTIAGLYMNRLNDGMPLQSDPTVIYALGDFKIQRVLRGDLDVNSPYNTYRFKGLPPGPIRLPQPESIDAVLNYKRNNYLYMCAEFGTGKHKFTSSYDQHLKNAKAYQDAMDKANINR
ncbi:MAG: endolytic transglycosylase MltG [Bacteroidota bacterium]